MSIKAYHFWSTTCSPCNAIKPAVQELREEFDSIQWVSVDFTKRNTAPDLPQLEVTKIPTIVVEVKQDDKLPLDFVGLLRFEEIGKDIEYILPSTQNKLPLFVIRIKK
jgi:thiol-disulfide isomerase/thioredoxin